MMNAKRKVSGSQGQWDSINVLDNRLSSFAARRPGGGVSDRFDTSMIPDTELDIALGFTVHDDHHDDDNMSVISPFARRETSSGSPRLATGGTVWINEEIRVSMRDVTDSIRQIFTTVQRFGPDERDAVRETLLDARDFLTKKVGISLFRCGCADVDSGRWPVRDAEINGNPRRRLVRANIATSRRGHDSSSRDDRRITSPRVRRRKKEKVEE
jgi:hypothetical protein